MAVDKNYFTSAGGKLIIQEGNQFSFQKDTLNYDHEMEDLTLDLSKGW